MASVWLTGTVGCTDDSGVEDDSGDEVGEAADPVTVNGFGWATIVSGAMGSSYNSNGGQVLLSSLGGTGYPYGSAFLVTFMGIPYRPETNAQVVGWGHHKTCKLLEPPSGNSSMTWVYVDCYGYWDYYGTNDFIVTLDSRWAGDVSPRRGAFLSTLGGTSPTVLSSWSSAKQTNSITWDAANQWFRVTLPGLSFENAGVHVTAIGNTRSRCKVVSWYNGSVNVRCHEVTGTAPTYEHFTSPYVGFSLSYQEVSQIPGTVGGHAWINNGSVDAFYSAARGASAPCAAPAFSAVPSPWWELDVSLPDTPEGSIPMVTAYGTGPEWCGPRYWSRSGTTTTVRVECMQPAWNGATFEYWNESKFTLSLSSPVAQPSCP